MNIKARQTHEVAFNAFENLVSREKCMLSPVSLKPVRVEGCVTGGLEIYFHVLYAKRRDCRESHVQMTWLTWQESQCKVDTRSVNKIMGLIQCNTVLTFKLQIEFVPFKIVPLGGYTPPETLFSLFVATLVVANRIRF